MITGVASISKRFKEAFRSGRINPEDLWMSSPQDVGRAYVSLTGDRSFEHFPYEDRMLAFECGRDMAFSA